MIELYRQADCSDCAEIQAALEEMVIAHKTVTVESAKHAESLPPDTPLPALKDNGQIITGHYAIAAHVKELQKFVKEWRKFQSDSCYTTE